MMIISIACISALTWFLAGFLCLAIWKRTVFEITIEEKAIILALGLFGLIFGIVEWIKLPKEFWRR